MDTIDVKYMESGHTYLECDAVHSQVEHKKKKKRIYSPSEMRVIVEGARENPCPYHVKMMNFSQFKDLKRLASSCVVNAKRAIDHTDVNYLRIKWLRFERGNLNVLFKYDYNDAFSAFNFNEKPPRKPSVRKNVGTRAAASKKNMQRSVWQRNHHRSRQYKRMSLLKPQNQNKRQQFQSPLHWALHSLTNYSFISYILHHYPFPQKKRVFNEVSSKWSNSCLLRRFLL